MHGLLLFLHVLGFIWWLGGGMGAMVAGIAAKHYAPSERLAVYGGLSALFRLIVAPGAFLVIATGIMLMLETVGADLTPGAGLGIMMGAGLLGAVLVLVVVVPTAAQLGRLTPDPRGELPERFATLRKRQVIFATIAGMLGLLALVGATLI